jgi:hypothetical protein
MSATATPLIDFVRDMHDLGLPPFREDGDIRLAECRRDLIAAACADDPTRVAYLVRQTRLERLWRIECWALAGPKRPRIEQWLRHQLGRELCR